MALLEVDGLSVCFSTPEGDVRAASDIVLSVAAGECLGVVGESGSGKSQIFLAAMGLLAANGRATGRVRLGGEDILGLERSRLNRIRGARMAMVFQDPMTSLNPYLRIGRQMTEVLVQHKGVSEEAARKRAIAMLERVRIPEAARRIDQYPHEFSGGMRQRAMIAMALLCEPELLIADEPTTALDVTIQAQILDLLADLRRESRTAIVLITHDLGVVAGLADRVAVLYAGRVVETAPVEALFAKPAHPYAQGLIGAMPRIDVQRQTELATIAGQPPNLQSLPPGCPFTPRCRLAAACCEAENPLPRPLGPDWAAACHFAGAA